MKHTLIRVALYCAIALVPACGSRKVQTDISKKEASQEIKTKEQLTTKEATQTKATEANTSLETNTKEGEKVTSVKKYDKDTGKLIEERNVIDKRKSASTKEKSSTRNFEETRYRLTDMRRTITHHVVVKTYDKVKESDSSNKPLYLAIFGIGSIAVLTWGVVRYLKR